MRLRAKRVPAACQNHRMNVSFLDSCVSDKHSQFDASQNDSAIVDGSIDGRKTRQGCAVAWLHIITGSVAGRASVAR
jgi:hypothetical protein